MVLNPLKHSLLHFQGRCELDKRKAIPSQSCTGSENSRSLRLPDFKTVDTWM
jgi:hypothetical protein